MNFLLVFFGGGLGCVLRYLIGIGFQRTTTSLPWATFTANIVACLIFAGVVWFLNAKELLSSNIKLLLLTGFCGGLSTFSSFGYETFLLVRQGLQLYAFLNVVLSTCFCVLVFYIFNKA